MPGSEPGLTRRQLLVSGAATGFALAAGPVSADVIRTDAAGLVAGDVEIPASDGAMPGYRASPASAERPPIVLVVHEIFGVHEYIRDVCRRLAKEGYFAVAPDLYRRQGDVSRLSSIAEVIEQVVTRVPDAQVVSDLEATRVWAGDAGGGDPQKVAITGFCWGGRVVWLYAAQAKDLDAGVAWYGRLEGAPRPETPEHPIDWAGRLHAPVLGLYGALDTGIPVASVETMRGALTAAESPSELVLYPEAPHGFHADYRSSYREKAATDGWRRMLGWFRQHGVG